MWPCCKWGLIGIAATVGSRCRSVAFRALQPPGVTIATSHFIFGLTFLMVFQVVHRRGGYVWKGSKRFSRTPYPIHSWNGPFDEHGAQVSFPWSKCFIFSHGVFTQYDFVILSPQFLFNGRQTLMQTLPVDGWMTGENIPAQNCVLEYFPV